MIPSKDTTKQTITIESNFIKNGKFTKLVGKDIYSDMRYIWKLDGK